MTYFAKPIAGTLYTRYHLLDGGAVVGTQISRPDGTEVPEPAHWHDRRPRTPAAQGGKQRGGRPAFHARGAVGIVDNLAQSRQRGAVNGNRASRRRIPKGQP
jgi:hypothetical protein